MIETITTKIPNRHGLKIAVLVEIPENPKGLMFIVHGFLSHSQKISPTAMAETALAHNLIAVRFDTTHSFGRSDGSPELATITSYIHDLEDVVMWSKTQPWFIWPYLLSGSSLGGITVLEHAHTYKNDVKAVAALAPVISGELSEQAALRRIPSKLPQWRETGFETREVSGPPPVTVIIPWSHMEDRYNYNVLAYAPQMTTPLFLYVGSLDESCPADQQQLLFDAWGADQKEFHIFENMPHGLHTPEHVAAYKARLSNWLAKIL
jgi:pimeloyl-ACP methyl ester carboxylesterase